MNASIEALEDPNNTHVSLLMIDVDFFKSVNDTYGHAAGDMVLKSIIDVVRHSLGPEVEIGRWGGEEFLCVITGMPINQVRDLGERTRKAVEDANFGTAGSITISVGITEVKPGESSDQVFSRVDEALYHSKENGRNCVTLI